jgi:virginiamycin B lyase
MRPILGIASEPDTAFCAEVAEIVVIAPFTEFVVPTPASQPVGVARGSDGNLWFTEQGAGKIERITPTGRFSEYALPLASSGPDKVAAAPGGMLRFTERTTRRIGSLNVATAG